MLDDHAGRARDGSTFSLPREELTYGWVDSFISRHGEKIHKGWIE